MFIIKLKLKWKICCLYLSVTGWVWIKWNWRRRRTAAFPTIAFIYGKLLYSCWLNFILIKRFFYIDLYFMLNDLCVKTAIYELLVWLRLEHCHPCQLTNHRRTGREGGLSPHYKNWSVRLCNKRSTLPIVQFNLFTLSSYTHTTSPTFMAGPHFSLDRCCSRNCVR